MDWSRAKSVLIFSFLLLNIILGYQLWLDVRERLNNSADLSDLPPATLRTMQEKNIRLSGSIPSEKPELRDLTYRFLSKPEERQTLEEPVPSTIVYSEKELMRGLGDVIPHLDQYTFIDSTAGSDGIFTLYRMNDGLPMFDVKLELYYSNQQIIAYRQDVVDQVQPGEAKAQRVLSALQVIESLIENFLQEGSNIQEIRLGYQGQMFDSDTQVSVPFWRVLLDEGEPPIYVHAISGDIVTESSTVSLDGV